MLWGGPLELSILDAMATTACAKFEVLVKDHMVVCNHVFFFFFSNNEHSLEILELMKIMMMMRIMMAIQNI